MKHFLFLLFFVYATIGFSQTEPKTFSDKYEEFDFYAKPDPKNELSKYFKNHLDHVLLEAIKYNDTSDFNKRVFLTFTLNKENKPTTIVVTSPYSELNRNIITEFKNYDFEKLNIPEKSILNKYTLQILSYKNGKTIINCSTNIVYDRYPVYEGYESNSGYFDMKNSINKLLESHIVKNISPDKIKKSKVLGKITLRPQFIINEKGAVELKPIKNPKDSLSFELNRVLALFPIAKTPPLLNGKPTKLPFTGYVNLLVDSTNKEYVADVVKSKDSTLNPNNELALHFKNFISSNELKKNNFLINQETIKISFSIDKKGKMIALKANSNSPSFNARLIEIFKNFPSEKLNINSTNVLETYNYNIISKAFPVNVIQCNDKPNVYINAFFDKHCEKSKSPDELLQSISDGITYYIVKSFDTNVRNKTKLSGDVKIYCNFLVDSNAKIISLKVRAPNPSLAKEMEDLIKNMPSFYRPAFMNGVAIPSSYAVPVIFKIGDNIPDNPFKLLNETTKSATY